ncbi:hypothetical protein [Catalinimonas niigatensis]|uniref:hypothetical protein n=1 Tax=Catalinimonas niigatensis TaxID=1397264 RepID=UPI0026664862|nr:hypothetical protein [Catalinimonas niigatensis]WPP53554.1 hypothetical protein PZB72_14360 [Catalinimonas niigatensis]
MEIYQKELITNEDSSLGVLFLKAIKIALPFLYYIENDADPFLTSKFMIKKKYSNELLSTIVESGFNANDFYGKSSFPRHSGHQCFEILLQKSPLNFRIIPFGESFEQFRLEYNVFAPGFGIELYPKGGESIVFEEVKKNFVWWLTNHVKPYIDEMEYPNYWTILKSNPLGIAGIDFSKNEPFKEEERKLLRAALGEIKGLLKENFDLNKQQYLTAEQKIHYLKEALERLNKTDWKGILFTTIITISYDLAFNAEKRDKLFSLFSKVWSILQALSPHIEVP